MINYTIENLLNQPMVGLDRKIDRVWYRFFLDMFKSTGAGKIDITDILNLSVETQAPNLSSLQNNVEGLARQVAAIPRADETLSARVAQLEMQIAALRRDVPVLRRVDDLEKMVLARRVA